MDRDSILKLKLTELKEKCTQLGLDNTGNRKALLQNRLYEHFGIEDNDEVEGPEVFADAFQEPRYAVTLRDIGDSISRFNGTTDPEVDQWIEEFEENAKAVHWDNLQKFVYAKQLLRGAALRFIRSQKDLCTWTKLKTALLKEFGTNITAAVRHKMLTNIKQKPNESLLEMLYRIIEIAKPMSVDDESLVEYFANAIPDSQNNKSMLYEARSIEELKNKLKTYEKVKQGRNFKKCLHCPHLNNHFTNDCRKFYNQCFICGQKGHRSNDCRQNKEGNQQNNTNFRRNSNYNQNHNQNGGRANRFNQQNNHNQYYNQQENRQNKFNGQNNNPVEINSRQQSNNRQNTFEMPRTQLCRPTMNMEVLITINETKLKALFDTGSDFCMLSESDYRSLGDIILYPKKIRISGVGQGSLETIGYVVTQVILDNQKFNAKFWVVNDSDLLAQSIIGSDILHWVNAYISDTGLKFALKKERKGVENILSDEEYNSEFEAGIQFSALCMDKTIEFNKDLNLDHLDKNTANTIANIVSNYKPDKTNEIKNSEIETKIILQDEIPVRHKARRMSVADQTFVEKQIDEWLDAGIIRPSRSPYSSPIVLAEKKDGSKRLCCDYRKLNRKIIEDAFPMIIIDDILAKLQNAKIFTTFDLKNGFFHVPMEKNSCKYTAFVTHHGQFEFLKTPFGLKNSPASFCRFISYIFHELTMNKTIMIYMDDIVIPSQTVKENLEKINQVLQIAQIYGLEINWKKSQFVKAEIFFLGYIIKDSTIRPSEEKIRAIKEYKEPSNIKSLQRFLGLAGYLRRFISFYSVIAKPLTDLLRQKAHFKWEEKERIAFMELKDRLTSAPVLTLYNPAAPTEVHTDASKFGYGAMLLQKDSEDGCLHPVEYMSRKTSELEEKYSSYELEILAIVEALKKWDCYLYGLPKERFKIVTDCLAYTFTINKEEVSPRVTRWIMKMQRYNFSVEHRPGSRLQHVDALSRVHCMMIQSSLKHSIIQAQLEDDYTSLIRQILEKKKYQDFYMKNNILYKDASKELIVIPEIMEREIIELAHNQGHFALKKTQDIIEKNFYIKNLSQKVEKYCKNCIQCIMVNQKMGKREGFLNPIDKADRPLHTFHIDHIGPMETTKKQYNYILTVVDAFSKFIWIFPTKSTTAEEVVKKMEIISATFGNPDRIISDRGTAFTSNLFQSYCEENQIVHHLITTGDPKANGQVERVHKIIVQILSKLSCNNKQVWYKYTNKVQQFINNTPPRSTKISPFKIMTGLNMKIPENIDFKSLIEEDIWKEMLEEKDIIRAEARKNIEKIQEENKKQYDRNRKEEAEYKIGELVAIKRTQFGTGLKLKPKYLGPYKIIKKLGNGRYEVQKIGEQEGPKLTTTNVEFMKKWNDSGRI